MGAQHRRLFEAVVRHELAHLRSGDLYWYQLATALRMTNAYTAAWFMVVAMVASFSGEVPVGQLTVATLRAAGLVLLAELIVRAFLRAREHYADLHAAQYGIDGLLAALPSGPESSTVRRWLNHHPGGRERSAVLQKPGVLLASWPGQLFLGATVAGVMLTTLQDILLTGEPSNPEETPILAGMMVGLPLALFTAFTIWRSAWHATVTGEHTRAVLFAAVLFTGLVIGSHLSPYSLVSGFGPTAGIPLALSVLLAIAVSALGLCLWLDALGTARARIDPAARRLDAFLVAAGLCACVVGMWLLPVLWTWAMRLSAIQLGCATKQPWAMPACSSATVETDIARSIGADYAFTPYSLLVVGLVAASLVAPKLLKRRRQAGTHRVAAITTVATIAVVIALWQVDAATQIDEKTRMASPSEFRLVHDVSRNIAGRPPQEPLDLETVHRKRQSQDPGVQQRALADLDCSAVDPLLGHTDHTLPLITCSADGTEKYLLGPVVLAGGDLEKAVAGPSETGDNTITITFTDSGATRWADLTTRNVGRNIAILVNNVVLIAPQINGPVYQGETTSISGIWSFNEARSLADLITGH